MTNKKEKDLPLLGKVALIINGAVGDGRSLALSVADYGADIALVCLPEEMESAEEVKKVIEGKRRRCLLITNDQEDKEKDVFSEVVDHFGKMDFFINYSLQKGEKGQRVNDDNRDIFGDHTINLLANIFKQTNIAAN